MPTENDSILEEKTPFVSPGSYSWQFQTLHMEDTVGAIFLGVLSMVLLIGWRRTESKYRALLAKQESTNGEHSLNS
jgi:hypothetical protein